MRLYEGSYQQFIEDTINNRIADKLKDSFENYYGHRANPGEVIAWTNSLRFLKDVIESKSLYDIYIVLEYELPYSTKRIDCILMGKDTDKKENVLVIELIIDYLWALIAFVLIIEVFLDYRVLRIDLFEKRRRVE